MGKDSKHRSSVFYAVAVAIQLGFLVVVTIGFFIFIGAFIDAKLHSHPIFLVLGIVLGIAMTFLEIRKLLLPLIEK